MIDSSHLKKATLIIKTISVKKTTFLFIPRPHAGESNGRWWRDLTNEDLDVLDSEVWAWHPVEWTAQHRVYQTSSQTHGIRHLHSPTTTIMTNNSFSAEGLPQIKGICRLLRYFVAFWKSEIRRPRRDREERERERERGRERESKGPSGNSCENRIGRLTLIRKIIIRTKLGVQCANVIDLT